MTSRPSLGFPRGGAITLDQSHAGVTLSSGVTPSTKRTVSVPLDAPAAATPKATDAWRWVALGVNLGLALLLVQQFHLESRTFFSVAALMIVGAAVNAALPLRFRLGFFAAISIATVFLVFGVQGGSILLALGLLLIGLCHLPASFRVRVALIAGVGLLLAAGRANLFGALGLGSASQSLVPLGVWAILGSMFMFRIAVYMLALEARTEDDPKPSLGRTLGYFFMAPNVCFPLFPVVDYNTFAKNHYDRPALEIYQTGARWIGRGLVHLILYRLMYTYVANDPGWLQNVGDLLRYLLSTYLLYFRISGSFHLIVGLLCLYGFRLPETHHLYFLAESFNDYWRRINIYWKDFMMKLVYYPSFFRLRKVMKGTLGPMTWATALVFFGTWILHSYQWFWLRGGFPITGPDILFWGILGVLVVWNARREASRGRTRVVSTGAAGWRGWRWSRAVNVLTTFSIICFLWSLWSAENIFEWMLMWRAAGTLRPWDLVLLVGLVGGGLLIAGRSWDEPATSANTARPWYRDPALATALLLLPPLALAQPRVQSWFGNDGREFLSSLQFASLNSRDAARQQRGYYEKMDVPGRLTQALWQDVPDFPADMVPFEQSPAYRRRNDFLSNDLTPNVVTPVQGYDVTINSWGMRGPETPKAKPAGTFRIAMLGPSYVFGMGSPDSSTITEQLAASLTRKLAGSSPRRIEVLNFGVPAYSIVQQYAMIEDRVYDFDPDVVVVLLERYISRMLVLHLTRAIAEEGHDVPYAPLRDLLTGSGIELEHRGRAVPFATLRSIARATGMEARMPQKEIAHILREQVDTIVASTIQEIGKSVRAHNAMPVAVAMRVLDYRLRPSPEVIRAMRIAEQSGITVLDLRNVYDGIDYATLRVSSWDLHPNATANKLIAERIANELMRQPGFLQRLGQP